MWNKTIYEGRQIAVDLQTIPFAIWPSEAKCVAFRYLYLLKQPDLFAKEKFFAAVYRNLNQPPVSLEDL